ncbi:flagellar basal-body MS-ring/collar protein FliF [Falsigemmobacter faecalis]|uniref:flagellar basal-body MS-ring/collar protein FliF n=1 Tax=Falsigemmobacter faecalis TaxID=2488730 RepID=UPI0013152BBE|nr:flagellar basal-body MS-ring/collar protein FliF [Falsigemmobacter faecalis]
MKQILANLASLGRGRLIALGATGLAIMAAVLFGLSVVLAPVYRPLAGDLSASEGAAMVRALEQAGFKPRVSPDGTLVSLPETDIARARMALAEAGVAAEGVPGWELFDNQSGLGMNTFLQQVNRLRALEGELARSVQTLDVVDSARVHLVLPEREAFSADRPEPSAAVIIRTRRGTTLERKQALSVRSLVAAALPGLSPERVTVLSASGETILAADGDSADGSGAVHGARIAMEERLVRNIEQILSARVGAGNVRVRVAAELATTREVILRESFDPDGRVARQTRSVSEAAKNSEKSAQSLDVLNNLPGAGGASDAGGGRSEDRSREEDETRFEIGSTRSETVIEPGGLRRLSVAVLVNGTSDDSGYRDRSPEELERLSQLVRSTMGFDESRGDSLTLDSLRFIEDGGVLPNAPEASVAESLLGHIPGMMRWIVALAMVAILVFGLRPVINRFMSRPASGTPEPEATPLPATEAEAEAAEVPDQAEGAERAAGDAADPEAGDDSDFVAISSVRGGVTRQKIEELGRLVEKDGDAALRQIRIWLNQKH